jgi:hypothetical protein
MASTPNRYPADSTAMAPSICPVLAGWALERRDQAGRRRKAGFWLTCGAGMSRVLLSRGCCGKQAARPGIPLDRPQSRRSSPQPPEDPESLPVERSL